MLKAASLGLTVKVEPLRVSPAGNGLLSLISVPLTRRACTLRMALLSRSLAPVSKFKSYVAAPSAAIELSAAATVGTSLTAATANVNVLLGLTAPN